MEFIIESNRIYTKNEAGKTVAEVTFPDIEKNRVEINHTFVDDSLRGQGIAGKLLKLAAEELRSSGRKAIPTCSYAIKWFEKHPEEADLLA